MDSNYVLRVPGEVVQQRGGATAVVYAAIEYLSRLSKDGWCWESQATIGEYVGLTDRSVRTHIRRLVEGGYLDVYSEAGQEIAYRTIGVGDGTDHLS